jgi:Domain of unknown function (DUF4145)
MPVRPGLIYDCPNCPAQNQGFDFLYSYTHPARGIPSTKENLGHLDFLIFACGNCHYPVAVEVYRLVSELTSGQPLQLKAGYKEGNYTVRSIRPARQTLGGAPVHTPSNVGAFYAQGCRALERGDADAAGMCFRKALDTATRYLIRTFSPPDLDAKLALKLKPRIDWLHSKGKLTDDLKAWAHLVRDEGNDAAHEEAPYTPEQAQDLRDLTEVFLMYVFTIPGKIAERHPEIATPVATTPEAATG